MERAAPTRAVGRGARHARAQDLIGILLDLEESKEGRVEGQRGGAEGKRGCDGVEAGAMKSGRVGLVRHRRRSLRGPGFDEGQGKGPR